MTKTAAEKAFADAVKVWKEAATPRPVEHRRVQYQEEKLRNDRIERLYLKMCDARVALLVERKHRLDRINASPVNSAQEAPPN